MPVSIRRQLLPLLRPVLRPSNHSIPSLALAKTRRPFHSTPPLAAPETIQPFRSTPPLAATEAPLPFNYASYPVSDHQNKMPPFHNATVGHLKTFDLPDEIRDNEECRAMARDMIYEWQKTGIFQIQIPPTRTTVLEDCFKTSKDFFQRSLKEKSRHVNDQSFAGYIASGEEMTDNAADRSEVFTITKDLQPSDSRVKNHWPCHGPTPWPNEEYKVNMNGLMGQFGEFGDKILRLTALGLGLDRIDDLAKMTDDGWHHMRVLRFPQCDQATFNGEGQHGRGIGAHTDYGLLVIAAQDDVGGLFVRPQIAEEDVKNWQRSAAGHAENDDKWLFVPPVPNTLTVFPGDMMQLLTNSFLPSTLHKVGLNRSERFAFAYFHEPNFSTVLETLPKFREKIHYGAHFTNMFSRSYPLKATTQRILQEGRIEGVLEKFSLPQSISA